MGTEFNKKQFDAIYPDGIEKHYWTFTRNKILTHILKKAGVNENILEVGCGRGVVVEYMVKHNLKIKGVELAEIPLKENLKANVTTGVDVFKLDPFKCKEIETILLLDVIEHIEKPEPFILELKEKFPALKRFIITVPACNELFSNYDEFNGHYRRYNISMLLNEFKNIKYKKAEVSYFFHLLYLPAKILLNTKGKRPEVIKAPKSFIQKSIHKVLAVFFYLEYFLFSSSLKGTSLVVKVELA